MLTGDGPPISFQEELLLHLATGSHDRRLQPRSLDRLHCNDDGVMPLAIPAAAITH